jgi:hypothetical protein
VVPLPGCVLLGPLVFFVFVFGSGLVRSLLSNFCFSNFFGFGFDFIALVCFCYVLLLLLFRTQVTMTNLQELYNVERQKMVKDVALLKQLKAQISEVQAMAAQRQQAESDEQWEDYEHLLEQLTQLTSRHTYPTLAVASTKVNVTQATGTVNVTAATEKIDVAPKNSEISISDDDFEPEPKTTSTTNNPVNVTQATGTVNVTAATGKTNVAPKNSEISISDDDFEPEPKTTSTNNNPMETNDSDDEFEVVRTTTDPTNTTAEETNSHDETVTDLLRGDIFASVTELQSKLQEHAQTHKFKIRREKDTIVCANAGCSNWTGITNYKARAKQALHRNQKKHDEEFAILDDNLDNSIEELLHTEEEKVGPQVTLSLRHTLTLFFY